MRFTVFSSDVNKTEIKKNKLKPIRIPISIPNNLANNEKPISINFLLDITSNDSESNIPLLHLHTFNAST